MDIDGDIGVFVSNLQVVGGGELLAIRLAELLDAPIYTVYYDPQAFDKRRREIIDNRVVNISLKSEYDEGTIEEIMDNDMPTVHGTITPGSGITALDISKLDRITSDAVIAVDNAASILAYRSDTPYITYVHHCAKGHTDFFFEQFDRQPEWTEKLRFGYTAWRYKRQVKGATKNSEHILPNSVLTKERAKQIWSVAEDDMTVAYPPTDTDTYCPGKPDYAPFEFDRYFLAPQRLEAYKNINVLTEAAKAAEEHLVFVGTGRMEDYIRREVHYSDYIHSVGFVEDEYLRDLYRGATATIQGTFREDFGMVPPESLATGTPCILPASGGFNETVGNGYGTEDEAPYQNDYGVMLDPEEFSVETLADAMDDFDPDDYDEDILRERAMDFSTEKFARTVVESVDEYLPVDVTFDD